MSSSVSYDTYDNEEENMSYESYEGEGDDDDVEEEDEPYDSYGYNVYRNHDCSRCEADRAYEYIATLKPVVFAEVPKLSEIASVNIAASLWNHVNITNTVSRIDGKCTKTTALWRTVRDKIPKLIQELPVPKSIAEYIETYVVKMATEITNWVSYHFRTVFLKYGPDKFLYGLIYHFVWHPNGTIDCKQTAKNMLWSPRLSEVEKFKFLATYCLKNEMEQLSPLVFMNNFMDYVNFSEYPLIYYWYCYFKNDLDRIPKNGNSTIDSSMFKHSKVDNWPAKEYFFERLESNEQVQAVIWLIDNNDVFYQKLVLAKLNETQRLLVYVERPVQIATYYGRTGVDFKDFFLTWLEIRNLITEARFLRIFDELLKTSTLNNCLIDVWTSAAENFKNYFLNFNNYEMIEKVLNLFLLSDYRELIFTILKDADVDTREKITKAKFFGSYCEKLLKNDKLSVLNQLINVCLPDVHKSLQYKYDFAIDSDLIKDYCMASYSTGNIEGVNHYLNQLLSPELILQYKKHILMPQSGILNEIIARFSYSAANCMNFLRTWSDIRPLITHDQFLSVFSKLLDFPFMRGPDGCNLFMELLKNESQAVKQEIITKKFFIDYCENLLVHENFSMFDRLLEFFFANIQECMRFKHNLLNNYSKTIMDICLKYYPSGNMKGLNDFLNYLSSSNPSIVMEYKENLLRSSRGIELCVTLLDLQHDILSVIIADSLPTADSAIAFKKTVVYSPQAISKFEALVVCNRLNTVQMCLDRYLTSKEDKLAVKKKIIGDPAKTMPNLLAKYDESYWQSFISWYFEFDGQLVEQFKQKLPVDQVFIQMLTQSLFWVYDRMLPRCKFKPNFQFDALNRFLIWYFKSSKAAKEYKLKRIYAFSEIEMINTLLRKANKTPFQEMMKWFFENDIAELTKFKMQYSKRKIAKYI